MNGEFREQKKNLKIGERKKGRVRDSDGDVTW